MRWVMSTGCPGKQSKRFLLPRRCGRALGLPPRTGRQQVLWFLEALPAEWHAAAARPVPDGDGAASEETDPRHGGRSLDELAVNLNTSARLPLKQWRHTRWFRSACGSSAGTPPNTAPTGAPCPAAALPRREAPSPSEPHPNAGACHSLSRPGVGRGIDLRNVCISRLMQTPQCVHCEAISRSATCRGNAMWRIKCGDQARTEIANGPCG
jgi:hypothetical protein